MEKDAAIKEVQSEAGVKGPAAVSARSAEPQPSLRMIDALAVTVGIVVGAGIFRTPSVVAANLGSSFMFFSSWLLGGLVSLVGALCYAELSTTYPSAGGDYHFINRAYGKRLAFLFAWARMSVIQTGSIAVLSFIVGDYLSEFYSFGVYSSGLYAGLVVVVLTIINILGVSLGTAAQRLLVFLEFLGIAIVLGAGFIFAPAASDAVLPVAQANASETGNSLGLAMVFVLLTFGGWNEAAYLSAELKGGRKAMAKALLLSIGIISGIYMLINLAYWNVLGLNGIAQSDAVAAQLMRITFGEGAVLLIGLIVSVAALTSVNATIFTGARTNFALGKDFPLFGPLGKWNTNTSSPINALMVQGLISLALIGMGMITRKGFETVVEYTAPVFWFFLLMTGIAVMVLRKKNPDRERPFGVPLYPLTPLIFCFTSAYLLYSSLAYTGLGALVGLGILLIGVFILFGMLLKHKKVYEGDLPGAK